MSANGPKKVQKKQLCPGKSAFLTGTKDLNPAAFRRLVARRARTVLGREVALLIAEPARRALEKEIQLEVVNLSADFLPARFLRDGSVRAEAVCRITVPVSATKVSRGTGFLIGNGLVMTNNHIIKTKEQGRKAFAEFAFEDQGETITVSFRPDQFFITDAGLDFTVIACETTGIEGDIEPIKLLRNPAVVSREEPVNIIQHPDGRPKEVAIHNNKVIRVQDKVIRYETDTEPGSSGSPVFNNDWELVALHHAGIELQGGRAENEGVRISAIISHVQSLGRGTGLITESAERLLGVVEGASPFLGFFDTAGLGLPRPEVEVPSFQGTPEFADVGFWNIEHFNATVSNQRIADVADVVAGLSMDALGLVEVEEPALKRLVEGVRVRGFDLDFVVQNVMGAQDLAVLFDRDTTKVELLNRTLEARFQTQLHARTPAGKTAFPRTPLFARCKVKDATGGEGTTFLMLVVHLKAFGDAESAARRALASRMLLEIIEDLRRTEGLPVLLGGDFNDKLNTSVFKPLQDSPDLFALTADDASTDAISFVGSSHRSLIDHIVVSRDTELGEISSDDAAIVRLDKSVADFAGTVSDHVPVVVRLVLRDKVVDVRPREEEGRCLVEIPEGSKRVGIEFLTD